MLAHCLFNCNTRSQYCKYCMDVFTFCHDIQVCWIKKNQSLWMYFVEYSKKDSTKSSDWYLVCSFNIPFLEFPFHLEIRFHKVPKRVSNKVHHWLGFWLIHWLIIHVYRFMSSFEMLYSYQEACHYCQWRAAKF